VELNKDILQLAWRYLPALITVFIVMARLADETLKRRRLARQSGRS